MLRKSVMSQQQSGTKRVQRMKSLGLLLVCFLGLQSASAQQYLHPVLLSKYEISNLVTSRVKGSFQFQEMEEVKWRPN